jgi:hypothetical protein
MELETTMLSDISQAQKANIMFSHMLNQREKRCESKRGLFWM